jgi:hypothetical protein
MHYKVNYGISFQIRKEKKKKQHKIKERAVIQQCDNTLSIPCSKLGGRGVCKELYSKPLTTGKNYYSSGVFM